MTFFEGFLEGFAEGAEISQSDLAGLVAAGQRDGMSTNAMLSRLNELGFGIRRQSFYQLAGEVRAATERAGELAHIAADQTLSEEEHAIWHGGQTDTYLYRVNIFYRESEQGVLGLQSKFWNVVSDTPLSQAEAVERASELFDENEGTGNYAKQTRFGAEVIGAYHQLGAA